MEKVRFNSVEEYLADLRTDVESPDVRIAFNMIRVTNRWVPTKMSPNIHHLSVVASHVRVGEDDRQIVELERYVGDIWKMPQDDKVKAKAEELQKKIVTTAAELGLEVRSGSLEPASEEKKS